MTPFPANKCTAIAAGIIFIGAALPAGASVFEVGSTSTKSAPEAKLSVQVKHKSSGKYSWKAPKFSLGMPVTPNLDIAIESLYAVVDPHGGDSHSGLGDTQLKSKWHFLNAGRFDMATQVKLKLPTGNEDRGLGDGHTSVKLPLIASYRLNNNWALGGEVGLKHTFHHNRNRSHAAVLLTRQFGHDLKLGTEWVAKADGISLHHLSHQVDAGFKWKLGHGFNVQGLYGHEIHSADNSRHASEYKLKIEKKFK